MININKSVIHSLLGRTTANCLKIGVSLKDKEQLNSDLVVNYCMHLKLGGEHTRRGSSGPWGGTGPATPCLGRASATPGTCRNTPAHQIQVQWSVSYDYILPVKI